MFKNKINKKIAIFSALGALLFISSGIGAYFLTNIRTSTIDPLTEEQKEFNKLSNNMMKMKSVEGNANISCGQYLTYKPAINVSIENSKVELEIVGPLTMDMVTTEFSFYIVDEVNYIGIGKNRVKFTSEEAKKIDQIIKESGLDLSFLEKYISIFSNFKIEQFMEELALKKDDLGNITFYSGKFKGAYITCDKDYNLSNFKIENFDIDDYKLNADFSCLTDHKKEIEIISPETEEKKYTSIMEYEGSIKKVTSMLANANGSEFIEATINTFVTKSCKLNGTFNLTVGTSPVKSISLEAIIHPNDIKFVISNIPLIAPITSDKNYENGNRKAIITYKDGYITTTQTTDHGNGDEPTSSSLTLSFDEFLDDVTNFILGENCIGLTDAILQYISKIKIIIPETIIFEKALESLTFSKEDSINKWDAVINMKEIFGEQSMLSNLVITTFENAEKYFYRYKAAMGLDYIFFKISIDGDITMQRINN